MSIDTPRKVVRVTTSFEAFPVLLHDRLGTLNLVGYEMDLDADGWPMELMGQYHRPGDDPFETRAMTRESAEAMVIPETTLGMIYSRPSDARYAVLDPEPEPVPASEAHVVALVRQDEKVAQRMSAEVETYTAADGHRMQNHKGASSAYAWHSDECACITNPEAWY